ncbi:MAG: tryptophan synthase subunit alpha [Cyclobacteriaceae bacterium]|nr:tryptophan synthase subunit alpha [Cyclobacteriaceae bacterium]
MKNRITTLLEKKSKDLLSVFYTAGFPSLEDTGAIAIELEKAGADFIEIGIPFSDPVADGPVIQESNKIALDNGMTLIKLLQQVRDIRKEVKFPIILMGYLNPVLQYGVEKFCKDASEAGVDGLIIPDMPMDEYQQEYKKTMDAYGLCNTFLISPTTSEERIRKIDDSTHGFIYAVSSSSTTGARDSFSSDQEEYFRKISQMKLKNPFLIGFGISNHKTFSTACAYGSGAIVGSSFISLLKNRSGSGGEIGEFVKNLKSN